MTEMNAMDRRAFLKFGGMGVAAALAPVSLFGKAEDYRSLYFHNLHTGESLRTVYWEEGVYHPEAIEAINKVLRDHRTGEIAQMDIGLLDLLHSIRTTAESSKPFNIISGYRSPKTNAMLQKNTSGVAKKSLHMQGKAIDINLQGVELAKLKQIAMHQKRGGVGYYPSSNFVHVDVGRVRYW
jgi:uncharacterized protein YcbK (DUF882 family)